MFGHGGEESGLLWMYWYLLSGYRVCSGKPGQYGDWSLSLNVCQFVCLCEDFVGVRYNSYSIKLIRLQCNGGIVFSAIGLLI